MGLNDGKYSNLRGKILAMVPLPTLEKIFNIVRQEEHHKNVMNDREEKPESAVAFAVRQSAKIDMSTLWEVRA